MNDYHDFIFMDGKFVGKFEEMYKTCDDPWHQSAKEKIHFSPPKLFPIAMIHKYNISSLVEFGCGLGYYTNYIHNRTGINILGVDVSDTAIAKARDLWQGPEFKVDSISNIANYHQYDSVLLAEITWYILDELDFIFDELYKHFKGKYFMQNLSFYKSNQKYGNEYFTSLKEFIEYCPFVFDGYCESTTEETNGIDTSAVFKINYK